MTEELGQTGSEAVVPPREGRAGQGGQGLVWYVQQVFYERLPPYVHGVP